MSEKSHTLYQPDLAPIFEEIDVLRWLVGRVWKLLRHVAWRSPTRTSNQKRGNDAEFLIQAWLPTYERGV